MFKSAVRLAGQASVASATAARLVARQKVTTGITGVQVHPEPLAALKTVYSQTLAELQKLPANSVYRQSTQALTEHRLKIVENVDVAAGEAAIEQVEQQLEVGSAEELIQIAEGELALLQKMEAWKPWEELMEKPAEDQWEYFDPPPSTTMPSN